MKIINLLLVLLFIAYACQTDHGSKPQKAKYVFYFIGDGLGLSHITLAEAYLSENYQTGYDKNHLIFFEMEHVGLTKTYAQNRLITNSAAAGTALASGYKTITKHIGLDPEKQRLIPITKTIKDNGLKVGVFSTVGINHATPAAFYAHVTDRDDYRTIARQMPEMLFDLYGGGGLIADKKEHPDLLLQYLQQSGLTILRNNLELKNLSQLTSPLYFINQHLDQEAAIPYAIQRNQHDLSLAEIVSKAIELLDNPNGFFIMAEGGKIDWANHANDASTCIHEVIDFSNGIKVALEFYRKHPNETLIVVCSDHETGGLSLGFTGKEYDTDIRLLKYQTLAHDSLTSLLVNLFTVRKNQVTFQQISDTLKKYTGVGSKDIPLSEKELQKLQQLFINVQKSERKTEKEIYPLVAFAIKTLNHRAGVTWGTTAHTFQPTMVFASGVGSEEFSGVFENTDLPKKIIKIMGLNHHFELVDNNHD
ncbi:MAG TPA: alkaline phosphatase [Salinivirgaceae bacterium]|nr:alkaline phosphatase [Salinivirgaceae bacterium]